MATLALFSHVGTRRLDQRLAVTGATPTALFLGRQLALMAIGVVVAGAYFALVAVTQDHLPRLHGVALLLTTTVLIGVPLGALVSFVITRELEGALALLSIMALQLLMDPADSAAKALPLWSTRELASYAINDQAGDTLRNGLMHFTATLILCLVAAGLASALRLRSIPIRQPQQAPAQK